MKTLSKVMFGVMVAVATQTSMATELFYVCSNQTDLLRSDLTTKKQNLNEDTLLEKASSRKTASNFARYKVVGSSLRGWVNNEDVCAKSTISSDTSKETMNFAPVKEPNVIPTAKPSPTYSGPARKIVINLSKNQLYYYEYGKLVRNWNVGTARAGKSTPTGNFKIWYKDICPPYFGSLGNKNVPGCTPENPFGQRALWFSGFMYGIHGTNEPHLIDSYTSASERRVSSGCIRNDNANINWLFEQVKVGDPVEIRW